MDIFHTFFYVPIFNILILLYRLFNENLGLALISVAFLSRLITIPITNNQIKAGETNQLFQKKYNTLKKKYKKNKEKFNQEAAKLQAKYLPGQIGGCLPMIIQLVMFLQIFNVLRNLFTEGLGAFNKVAWSFVAKMPEGTKLHDNFLGVLNLGTSPADIAKSGVVNHLVELLPYLILLLLVMVTQFLSAKILTGLNSKKDKKEVTKVKKAKDDNNEAGMGDIMKSTMSQMQFVLPIMIGFFTYTAASGLALYWTVQSTFVIIQGLIKNRANVIKKLNSFFK